MNKYQYKEMDHANAILENGFITKYIGSELKILAKFYKKRNLDSEQIKEKLHTFCKDNLHGYNKAIHYKIINAAVNFTNNPKNKLIQIDKVDISKKEIEYIDSLDISHDFKRVVFTLLVLNKLTKLYVLHRDGELKSQDHYFGGYKNYRELVSLSKIKFDKRKKSTVKNIHDLIHLLHEKGIVEITSNGNVKLSFMYGIEEDDEVALTVSNYENIGLYYDLHHERENVKICENVDCGIIIRLPKNKRSASQIKYCKECSADIKTMKTREIARESMRKLREERRVKKS